MPSPITLIKGARLIVEHCMTVKKNDKVLVIADDDHMAIAECIAGVAVSLGAYPVVANVTHHVKAAMASMAVPMLPPEHLCQAMLHSDEIIITTNLEWANRFAHVDPVKGSVERGAKIASVEEGLVGDNAHCYPGGQSRCSVHLDGSLRDVSIEVDDRPIMQDGQLII